MSIAPQTSPKPLYEQSVTSPTSSKMLAITPKPPSTRKTLKPNLLPCTIKHNGPISTHKRYWQPSTASDGTSTAYLRGRKLRGRTIRIPEGYQGYVLQKTDKLAAQTQVVESHSRMDDETVERVGDGLEKAIEVKVMEEMGRFDEMVVWGHEVLPDEGEDEYVRGVEEWIAFAEAMHTNHHPKSNEPLPSESLQDEQENPSGLAHQTS